MKCWARIENNTVEETTTVNPEGRFHPSLTWAECNDEVEPGYIYDGIEYFPPNDIDI
ncbi:MAG TPA: hypothetical protein VGL07_16680 [Buttiauxella sp.]|jgi:hypothetical protein